MPAGLIQGALERIDLLDRQIADLNQQIGDLVAPLTLQMEQLTSLPGVETTAARVILAEIGTDMSRFGADTRLASWAGMCVLCQITWFMARVREARQSGINC